MKLRHWWATRLWVSSVRAALFEEPTAARRDPFRRNPLCLEELEDRTAPAGLRLESDIVVPEFAAAELSVAPWLAPLTAGSEETGGGIDPGFDTSAQFDPGGGSSSFGSFVVSPHTGPTGALRQQLQDQHNQAAATRGMVMNAGYGRILGEAAGQYRVAHFTNETLHGFAGLGLAQGASTHNDQAPDHAASHRLLPWVPPTPANSPRVAEASALTISQATIQQSSADCPVAHNDSYTVHHGNSLSGNVLANDSDPSGTASLVSNAQHGTLNLAGDGSFTYTSSSFAGTDFFTYKFNNGTADSNVATVAIEVTNQAPFAFDEAFTTPHDQPFTSGVQAGDPDVDPVTVNVISQSGGSVVMGNDGTFTFTPEAKHVGSAGFTYALSDGVAGSNTGNVLISVTEDPPRAIPASGNVEVNTSFSGSLSAAGEVTSWTLGSAPQGNMTFDSRTGEFTYTAPSSATTDSFTFTVSNGITESAPAIVYFNVHDPNSSAWQLDSQALETPHDTITGGCFQPGRTFCVGAEEVIMLSSPQKGTLTIDSTNTFFDYTPNPAETGQDSFSYRLRNGSDVSMDATVSIAIFNGTPFADNAAYFVTHGNTFAVDARAGLFAHVNSDDPVTISIVSGPQHGTLNFDQTDGSFTYDPDLSFAGTDSFGYKINDGVVDSNTGTVLLVVTNSPPVAHNESYLIFQGGSLAGNVLGDDTDPDDGQLTASLVSSVAHGSLTFNSDGSFDYRPDASFAGTDMFTYKAIDAIGEGNVGTVLIEVEGECHGIISGMKFEDVNGNGVKDAGEPGLVNWEIDLDKGADGSVDDTTVTDDFGFYSGPVDGVTVYFEVIDPDDRSPYTEDNTPLTHWEWDSNVNANHNIEGTRPGGTPDTDANDNRDPDRTLAEGTLAQYQALQANSLRPASAISQIRTINGVRRGVAEVEFTITPRFAGDNYQVRATTRPPLGKPFNLDSGVRNAPHANIDDAHIAKSAVLEAWWRIYYEVDTMYKKGSLLQRNAAPGNLTIKVEDTADFQIGSRVRIFDSVNRTGIVRHVVDIDRDNNILVLDAVLTADFSKSRMGFVGIDNRSADDFFLPNTTALHQTFDEAYLEVVHLTPGSEAVPLIKDQNESGRRLFERLWFNHRNTSNYFYLVGAHSGVARVGVLGVARPDGITDDRENSSFVYLARFETADPQVREKVNIETVNHEVVHQLDDPRDNQNTFHDSERAWDLSDRCLMDISRTQVDGRYELGIDHLYKLRDFRTGI